MTLKELRLSKGLTQKELASLAGVSLRSYKDYENKIEKQHGYRYEHLLDALNKYGYIDEEHGILTLDQIKDAVAKVFEEFDVEYCYLFGSYAKGEASDGSDVDLLVRTDVTGMHFFGLCERLREALHKKVDLLEIVQLNNNPKLINEILKYSIKIYAKE